MFDHWQVDQLAKIGSADLAREFGQEFVVLILRPDPEPEYWRSAAKNGDVPMEFYVLANTGMVESLYCGKVLLRDRNLIYYDRYPYDGCPYEVGSRNSRWSQDLTRRTNIILKNLEQLLGYDDISRQQMNLN